MSFTKNWLYITVSCLVLLQPGMASHRGNVTEAILIRPGNPQGSAIREESGAFGAQAPASKQAGISPIYAGVVYFGAACFIVLFVTGILYIYRQQRAVHHGFPVEVV